MSAPSLIQVRLSAGGEVAELAAWGAGGAVAVVVMGGLDAPGCNLLFDGVGVVAGFLLDETSGFTFTVARRETEQLEDLAA